MRHTKIVCTLGPASNDRATLTAMINAGMDVVRLNTTHGTMDEHLASVRMVREVAKAAAKSVGVLMDLSGPKLRTGETQDGRPIELEAGAATHITPIRAPGTKASFTVDYADLTREVRAGDRVLLDDGKLELEVTGAAGAGLDCRVVVGGPLGPRKGVSFPNTNLSVPALTIRDQDYVRAGVAAGVDFFAVSFVRDAADVVRARDLLRSLGANTPIIAKIERRLAVENLEAIMAEADGAMVARGDLGVEIPPEDVPVQQRRIISASGRHRIPVITATQMLESMVHSPRPTRAESSDVANAVWDLSDALMPSQETAIGQYPVETVAMMDRIIRKAEGAASSGREMLTSTAPKTDDHAYVVALAAHRIVESDLNMRAIVCFTRSGHGPLLLSKVHPTVPIYALTPNEAVFHRLSLARSVVPILAPNVEHSAKLLQVADQLLTERGHVRQGDEVVVVASLPVEAAGVTNFLKLHRVGESAGY